MLNYTTTPVQEINNTILDQAGVRLLVKREDLNHRFVSGNKWWKLKYNLEEAKRQQKNTLLTFGGAYSNHIFSTAAAARESGFKSIGIIRGEETLPINPTLQFARECGMHLHYIAREPYRHKQEPAFIQHLHDLFDDFYLIPEGGTNAFAISGCAEFAQTELNLSFDFIMVPVGTGGTMAGIVAGLRGSKTVLGVSTLRGGDFLMDEVTHLVQKFNGEVYENWSILTPYHHGGYAKVTKELLAFMDEMRVTYNLPLDHVYTGKLLWAVMEEVKNGTFPKGSTVLALHTGGLQTGLLS